MRIALVVAAASVAFAFGPAEARDRLEIVGAASMEHFSTVVSERFARITDFPAPRVQQTGNGGGFALFCAGVGQQHPDMIGASRPMTEAEFAECQRNGVRNVTEIKIGHEAIVLAVEKSSPVFPLTKPQLFAALAKTVEAGGEVAENAHRSWQQIDAALPEREIALLGPAAGVELHDALVRDILLAGCMAYPNIAALQGRERDLACSLLRTDGRYEGFREDDPNLVSKLRSRPESVGIMSFAAFEEGGGAIVPLPVEGTLPTIETIADDSYGLTQTLYLYTKNQHYGQIPGFLEFVNEYTSEAAWGLEGYLVDEGLMPLSDSDRSAQRANAIGLNPMF